MLRLLGFEMTRAVLPLANGTGGVQVAAGLAIGFAAFRSGAVNRAAAFMLIGATLVCILLTDSRGGLLGGVAGMAAAAAPAVVRGRLRWLTPMVLVLPIVMILAIGALSDGGVVQAVSRAGEGSVGPLSGRPIIWGTIFVALSRFQLQHLIGFGAFGQVASGVNSQYAFLFSTSYASTTTAGAHNTLLQLVLDCGYVGVALYLFLSWSVLSCFAAEARRGGGRGPWAIVGSAAMVSLLVLGVTDATLTITNTSTLVLFFALNLHCLAFGGHAATEATRAPRTDPHGPAPHVAD